MTTPNQLPSQVRLLELLTYDPETGIFMWRESRAGQMAGVAIANKPSASHRYTRIQIEGVIYRAHRLAWKYVHGVDPEGQIDHIDGDGHNNRLANLRDVPEYVTHENQRTAHINRKHNLPLGVLKNRKTFTAQIRLAGKSYHIGTFSTPEEAHQAYIAAKRQLHEGCTI